MSSPFVCLFVQEYLMIKAAFLAFGGQLRTTSSEDNALNTTFRELGLSKQRRKTEKVEISM